MAGLASPPACRRLCHGLSEEIIVLKVLKEIAYEASLENGLSWAMQ